MWKADKSPEAPGRLENLKELVRALADFETLGGFLDHVSLVMENEETAEGDRLSLMTLHGAKGLEFDTVFLPGWEEGLFPNQRSLDESGAKGLEEERRLAYVGLTRARRRAIVSHAANRRIYANWQSQHPQPLHRRTAGRAYRAHRLGGAGARARIAAPGFTGAVPAGRATAEGGGCVGAAGPPGAQRRNPGRHARIPPEIRLRHRHRGRGRQAGRVVRQGGRRSVCSTGSWRRLDGAGRDRRHREPTMVTQRAVPLETVAVDVPESALEAYEAALGSVCATVGFFRDDATGLWRVEGVKEVGVNDPALDAALALAAAASGVEAVVARTPTPVEGWLARTYASFPEQHIGRRFAVRGTHLSGPATPGRITLTLDAGIAFGSGEHGSTRGCLRALERVAHRRPRRILDLGTGSGILAMAAAGLLHRRVLATDIEPWSVRVAQQNAVLNGLGPTGAGAPVGRLAPSAPCGQDGLTTWCLPISWPARCAAWPGIWPSDLLPGARPSWQVCSTPRRAASWPRIAGMGFGCRASFAKVLGQR